ncbi:hypothetical protein F1880_008981 [Penicillium rolfsii]|nr:hypothetical protein F1880_008981 [Penicillium rolfsii]
MCSRCPAYGVPTVLRRVKRSGSFPARVAISATLPVHEGTILLVLGQTGRHCALSRQRSIS